MKRAAQYFAACCALVAALAPVYWLITISLKREIDQFAYPPRWMGFAPTLQHYAEAFGGGSFAV
jgi:ABC-type glycerol-3-phosphate transport system permease component